MKIEVKYCNGCSPLNDYASVMLKTSCLSSGSPIDDAKYRVVVCRSAEGCEYPQRAFAGDETFFVKSMDAVNDAVNDILVHRKKASASMPVDGR